jgi:osmotically-inducible protein OsmY
VLVSDTVLNIKVRNALQSEPALDDLGLRVTVQDGIVTLEGRASNERLKLLAGQLAENVYGVEEVDNRIAC